MDIKDFLAALEPQQATTADADPSTDLVLLAATSAAVSLKRIADAQQGEIITTQEELSTDPWTRIADAMERQAAADELRNLLLLQVSDRIQIDSPHSEYVMAVTVDHVLAPFRDELKAAKASGRFD